MYSASDSDRRDEILLDTARQRCLDRIRTNPVPDTQDVIVVSLWRLEDRIVSLFNDHWSTGIKGKVREYGPHWGMGAGGAGILIALFEAIGRIFGN